METIPKHWTSEDERQYGRDESYQRIAALLELHGINKVQDWGCGGRAFEKFWPFVYEGVDRFSPLADIKADLTFWRPEHPQECVLIRHILEHEMCWPDILRSAIQSSKWICLVTFEKLVDCDDMICEHREQPCYYLNSHRLLSMVVGRLKYKEQFENETLYLMEGVY